MVACCRHAYVRRDLLCRRGWRRASITGAGAAGGIVAVITAAGRSSRTGERHKLLATDAAGRSMIARTLAQVASSRVAGICVVVPDVDGRVARAAACAIEERTDRERFVIRLAADAAQGLSASLRAGVAYARDCRAAGVVICLGDMPLVTGATIDALAECHRATGADAVVPECDGRPGNPVLWDARRFGDLMGLTGDEGARKLLRMPGLHKVSVSTDASIFVDFDTPEALDVFAGL
ncbi:NTP transferase domain-containing protein [Acetobacter musti]|uniref:NTP transferase domain-containing protein n=1 Tax=Acetobacter musti TaxID=864732 RepID=UPI00156A8987